MIRRAFTSLLCGGSTAALGTFATYAVRMQAYGPMTIWENNRPDYIGTALFCGGIGAALAYLHDRVFATGNDTFTGRAGNHANGNYFAAMLTMALIFAAPVVVIKLLQLDVQFSSNERAGIERAYQKLKANPALRDYEVGPWSNATILHQHARRNDDDPWPHWKPLLAMMATLGGVFGLLCKADERDEFLLFVLAGRAVGGIGIGIALSGALTAPFIGIPGVEELIEGQYGLKYTGLFFSAFMALPVYYAIKNTRKRYREITF